MIYTLTRTALKSLSETLAAIMDTEPQSLSERLQLSIMHKLWKKTCVALLDQKSRYRFTIDRETHLAIASWFSDKTFRPSYATLLIKEICDRADKEYGN